MGPIRDPPAFPFDILPRRDRGRRPDHGYEIPVATDFDAQDAKARLLAMKGHTLDRTSEVFRRMGTGWCLCKSIHRLTTAFLGCSSTYWRWKETIALVDGQDAHGEKHTTPLSHEQDRGTSWLETAPIAPVPGLLCTQLYIERGHKILLLCTLTS